MRERAAANRADTVRQRRRQQSGKRMTESASYATRPLTPIVSRAGVMPAPRQERVRQSTRRRERAPVSMPGIEIRLPAIRFSRSEIKWRAMSFVLSLILGTGIYLAWNSSMFRAAVPSINGNVRIAAEELGAVMGTTGVRVFDLVPSQVEQRLRLNYPELLAAAVTIGLPNKVEVHIVEREPAILWRQADGYTWIDAAGVAFRPRGTAEDLITVEAREAPIAIPDAQSDPLTPGPFLARDLVEAIQELAASAPDAQPIIYDGRYGLGWDDPRGWQVFFGDQPADMALRLRVYKSVVQLVDQEGITPIFISVQYPDAPYYRMNQ